MQDLVHLVRGESTPTHSISQDLECGIIRVVVRGSFDRSTLAAHFAEKARMIDAWRAAQRPICVLIDAVELCPHSPENQACVERSMARIYGADDRVAMLVSSSLVKMQMRRALMPGERGQFFLSQSAAIKWLTANLPLQRHMVA